MSFSSLGLRPEITDAVQRAGYVEPTPIQQQAIPAIIERRDVVGIAQTGTGKTAAFVLPMLQILSSDNSRPAPKRTRALILVPTRELAVQVEQNVRKYSQRLRLRSAMIFGGVGEHPQIAALRNGVDLLIATPGRLLDLMAGKHVDLSGVKFLVLDEADRMLDMGFLPQIRRVVTATPEQRQTLLFSATFSKEIEETARQFLKNPTSVEVSRRNEAAKRVEQSVVMLDREQKLEALTQLLSNRDLAAVLVFTRTKHGADKVTRKLASASITAAAIHSNRSQAQRLAALEKFRRGEIRVLVATDIASRGIDVRGISHVINFDLPATPEDYVHRIGRTGRAESDGEAITFVTSDQMNELRAVEKVVGRTLPRRSVTLTPVSREQREASAAAFAASGARHRAASRANSASHQHHFPGGRPRRPHSGENRPGNGARRTATGTRVAVQPRKGS